MPFVAAPKREPKKKPKPPPPSPNEPKIQELPDDYEEPPPEPEEEQEPEPEPAGPPPENLTPEIQELCEVQCPLGTRWGGGGGHGEGRRRSLPLVGGGGSEGGYPPSSCGVRPFYYSPGQPAEVYRSRAAVRNGPTAAAGRSRAHQEITASVRSPGGGEIFPFRNFPRPICPLANLSPPPPCRRTLEWQNLAQQKCTKVCRGIWRTEATFLGVIFTPLGMRSLQEVMAITQKPTFAVLLVLVLQCRHFVPKCAVAFENWCQIFSAPTFAIPNIARY